MRIQNELGRYSYESAGWSDKESFPGQDYVPWWLEFYHYNSFFLNVFVRHRVPWKGSWIIRPPREVRYIIAILWYANLYPLATMIALRGALDWEANLVLSASYLMIGMFDSKLIIFTFILLHILYIITSTSLYVLLQCYAILRKSLPYTLHKHIACLRNVAHDYTAKMPTTTVNYVDYESNIQI